MELEKLKWLVLLHDGLFSKLSLICIIVVILIGKHGVTELINNYGV